MNFELEAFIKYIEVAGLSDLTKYRIVVTPPQGLMLGVSQSQLSNLGINAPTAAVAVGNALIGAAQTAGTAFVLNLMAQTVKIPGIAFNTSELKVASAPIENRATGRVKNEFTVSYLCPNTLEPVLFHESWMNYIKDPYTGKLSFYDDYITDVMVEKLTNQGDGIESLLATRRYILSEVYPTSIDFNELSSQATNRPMTLNVTYAYKNCVPHSATGGLISAGLNLIGK